MGKRAESWHDFLAALPPKDFRFCVFDLTFTNHDNMNISKIFFCNWSPDAAPLKTRMLYATAKENFRSALDLNGKEITVNSIDDVPSPPRRSTRPTSSRSSTSDPDCHSISTDTHPYSIHCYISS